MTRTDDRVGSRRSAGGARRPAGDGLKAHALAALVAAPDRLVLILFWTCIVVSATVLADAFRPALVLPILAIVLVATWRLAPAPVAVTRSHVFGALGAIAFALVWLVANAPFASQWVVVNRDPGFLTLEGIWLSTHASPGIPIGNAADLAQALPDVDVTGAGYTLIGGDLQAQGLKLVPGLLGLAGWVGGVRTILLANLVLGALALLATYGLARRLVSAPWALVPLVALGLSLPMIAFSRTPYTEPVTLALAFGGLSMSWSAYETRRWWRHLLAGCLVGASALSRIDGAASVIGIVAGIGLAAAAATLPRARSRNLLALGWAAVGAAAMVGLGYLDVTRHAILYYRGHSYLFRPLLAVLAAVATACFVLAVPRFLHPVRRWFLRHRRGAAATAGAAVAVVALALVTRPLWLVERRLPDDPEGVGLVPYLQQIQGLDVDPTRSYDEMTVTWLAWYIGWVAVAVGFAGLAYLAYRSVRHRDPRPLVVLAVVAAPSVLFFTHVSVTPDQIWAIRRLLPVTIPGFLVAATVVIEALWRGRRRSLRWAAAAVAVVVALFPLTTWTTLLSVVQQDHRLDEAQTVCDAIAGRRTLLATPASPPYLATIRAVCDVETARIEPPVSRSLLREVREEWGDDVAVVTFSADAVPWSGGQEPAPLRVTETREWDPVLNRLPHAATPYISVVWVGHIEADGTVTAVPPAGQ